MSVKIANNAFGVLVSGVSSSDTVITLDAGAGARFPALSAGDYFYATLIDVGNNLEIVKITARAADTLTAIRGQDGTAARAFDAGDRVEIRPTAILFRELAQAINNQYDNTVSELLASNTQDAVDALAASRVVKAASSTNNALTRFSGTTGQQLKNSTVTLDDQGNSVFNSVGGTVATPTSASDIVLTNASAETQFATLNGTRLRVRLPDATTLAVGRKFRIRNVGYDEFAIALNDNWMVRALLPGQEDTLTLLNNTTANGTWHSEVLGRLTYKFGMPTFFANTLETANTSTGIRAVLMSGGSTIVVSFVDRAVSSARPYAVAGAVSGQSVSFGSATAVRTSDTANVTEMVALSSSRVFAQVCRTTSSIVPYGLNISGTTISVSAAGSGAGTSGSTWTDMYRINDQHLLTFYPSGTNVARRIYRHNDSSAPTAGANVNVGSTALELGSVSAHVYSDTRAVVFYARTTNTDYVSLNLDVVSATPASPGTLVRVTTAVGPSSRIGYAALSSSGRFLLNINNNQLTFGSFDTSAGGITFDANARRSPTVFDINWSTGGAVSNPTELIRVDENKFVSNWTSVTALSSRVLTFMDHDGDNGVRRLRADLGFTQDFPAVTNGNTHLAVDPGSGRIAYVYTLDGTGFYTVILERI